MLVGVGVGKRLTMHSPVHLQCCWPYFLRDDLMGPSKSKGEILESGFPTDTGCVACLQRAIGKGPAIFSGC